ncbi:hypothetical protein KP509_10G063400 [Ceratopteris richardii]|uniref:Aminopeptidase n=1 Tax=Ceratopteris richardii TaxID=49495 RepID=A0A8T2TZN2_CERRI|nr:hypothetical protein KP509_10G063400 [Ceratopteris richardii]
MLLTVHGSWLMFHMNLQLDSKLFSTYFANNPQEGLPGFVDQYVIFRQGVGIDRTTDYFITEKIDALIGRFWEYLIQKLRLRRLFFSKQLNRASSSIRRIVDSIPDTSGTSEEDLYVERIRIQNLSLSVKNLLSKTTVQEPTFERIVLIYRCATPSKSTLKHGDRAIHIKQFRNIPMADMELVLPEKKNPGLTPMDWTKLLITAGLGLVTLVTSLEMPKADFWVVSAILMGVIGYCVKIFLSFQQNLIEYQNLITRSMYEKQLDSGRGTLLHICDDMIQQEVKEVILAYFVLISRGRASKDDLDKRCEELMLEEFQEKCDFEVEDAVKKMERLGIVTRDSVGRYCHVPLSRANEIIGLTTEERVSKASGS